jgi:dTDP-4-amino-4,6-dideoxygalactose transaminase
MTKDAWKRYLPELVPTAKHYSHYDIKYTGYKYNMADLQAAMGICQLNKINKMWKKRKKLYENYFRKLKNLPVYLQRNPDYSFKHGFHLFVMVLDKKRTNKTRDGLIEFLRQKKIGSAVHYRSITEMSNYKKLFGWKNDYFPNSYYVGRNIISLPLYSDLSIKSQNYIISQVQNFFNA